MPGAAAQLGKAQHFQRTTMLRPSLVITAMVAAPRGTQQSEKPAGTCNKHQIRNSRCVRLQHGLTVDDICKPCVCTTGH